MLSSQMLASNDRSGAGSEWSGLLVGIWAHASVHLSAALDPSFGSAGGVVVFSRLLFLVVVNSTEVE